MSTDSTTATQSTDSAHVNANGQKKKTGERLQTITQLSIAPTFVKTLIKETKPGVSIGMDAAIRATGATQTLVNIVLEHSRQEAENMHKKRITTSHVNSAISNNPFLNRLLPDRQLIGLTPSIPRSFIVNNYKQQIAASKKAQKKKASKLRRKLAKQERQAAAAAAAKVNSV